MTASGYAHFARTAQKRWIRHAHDWQMALRLCRLAAHFIQARVQHLLGIYASSGRLLQAQHRNASRAPRRLGLLGKRQIPIRNYSLDLYDATTTRVLDTYTATYNTPCSFTWRTKLCTSPCNRAGTRRSVAATSNTPQGLTHVVDLSATVLATAELFPLNREQLQLDGNNLMPLITKSGLGKQRTDVSINIINSGLELLGDPFWQVQAHRQGPQYDGQGQACVVAWLV